MKSYTDIKKALSVADYEIIGQIMIIKDKCKKWNIPTALPFEYKMYAFDTPEFREPKKGEYFISGAKPELYKAPNDLSTKYLTVTKIYPVKAKTIYERV